jgi:hypothetical protein
MCYKNREYSFKGSDLEDITTNSLIITATGSYLDRVVQYYIAELFQYMHRIHSPFVGPGTAPSSIGDGLASRHVRACFQYKNPTRPVVFL